ncbi:MaoC family dehydratase [Arachidicoccus ginsenosidimutans]|uniref:MaoC family dehydratase n=1 Tax=Arachidicoccus sp. BS20 TaxID=1850526 RepID=UPI0018D49205|nr:MaoC family dehydratase [Arachidicoccus sp. BS20]
MTKPKIGDIFKHDFIFTHEQVLAYANISGDTNPIHVSEQYAEQTNFKRCIVHGYFSISIFSKVYGTLLYPEEHILISQTARYIKPVFTGIEYTAIFTTKEFFPDKNRVCYINEIIEKQTGEIKVTGEAFLMNKKYYK